jgi:hypothetical protein
VAVRPLLDLGRFSVSWPFTQTVGLHGWGVKAAVYTNAERTQTSVPQIGFEPTITVFGRAKTVDATVIYIRSNNNGNVSNGISV